MNWQTKTLILIGAILLIALSFSLPLITSWLYWFALFFLSMVGLLVIGIIVLTYQINREKLLDIRATRKQKEYQAEKAKTESEVYVVTNGSQTFIRDINHSATWRQAHLDPRLYANGHVTPVELDEAQRWQIANASKALSLQASTSLLNASESELDLLSIFTQSTQSYAIIAGQQVGKTFQAQRIAQHWLDTGLKPIVIGPKWDKGEWTNCALFGGEYNFERVSQGMRIVQKMAQKRHEDKGRSHKEQSIQPVFFDDWTAIRAKLPTEAEAFILDATTLYASVNIILYFIIHLDTANAWGVGKIGAALHQNFIKLRIEPGFNEAGLVDRSRNVGWLLYPGKSIKDKVKVRLFGGTGQPLLLPDLVIQPTKKDADTYFVELVQSGLSRNKASMEAYGRAYAGDLVDRGKKALGETSTTEK